MEWFVARQAGDEGPFSLEEMRELIHRGQLSSDDYVWCAGMADWKVASAVPGFFTPPERQTDLSIREATSEPQAVARAEKPLYRPNFFARHWSGDLSLGVSYWLCGALVTTLVRILDAIVAELPILQTMSPTASGTFSLSYISGMWLITIWQLVGIWRSASKHVGRGGRNWIASLVKVLVALGWLASIAQFVQFHLPILTESIKLIGGVDETPPFQIRLLSDGKEMELGGGISRGTANAVKQTLEENPRIELVHLNNTGGWLDEAYEVNRILRSRKLNTYTATSCISACTIAFLGGEERLLGSNAKLGFHSTSYGYSGLSAPELNEEVAATLKSIGAPSAFISRALNTSPNDIWFPTNDELLSAHVVTAIVDSRYYGLSGIAEWRDAFAIEQELLKIPAFSAIALHDKKAFERIRSEFVGGIQEGRKEKDIIAAVRAIVMGEVIPRYMAVAPDGPLLSFWQVQLDEVEALRQMDARLCRDFLFPQQAAQPVDLTKHISSDLALRDLRALDALIVAGATSPVSSPSQQGAEAGITLASVVLTLPVEFQNVLVDIDSHMSDAPAVCDTMAALFRAIAALEPNQAANVLRGMFRGQ